MHKSIKTCLQFRKHFNNNLFRLQTTWTNKKEQKKKKSLRNILGKEREKINLWISHVLRGRMELQNTIRKKKRKKQKMWIKKAAWNIYKARTFFTNSFFRPRRANTSIRKMAGNCTNWVQSRNFVFIHKKKLKLMNKE